MYLYVFHYIIWHIKHSLISVFIKIGVLQSHANKGIGKIIEGVLIWFLSIWVKTADNVNYIVRDLNFKDATSSRQYHIYLTHLRHYWFGKNLKELSK